MASRLAPGYYNGKVTQIGIGVTENKETPFLRITCKPTQNLAGEDDASLPRVDRTLWLKDTVIQSGRNAGKTLIQCAQEELKEYFDYSGGLDEEALSEAAVGKDIRFLVEVRDEKYPEIKFFAKQSGGERKLKQVDPLILSRLKKTWGGASKSSTKTEAKAAKMPWGKIKGTE